MMKLWSEIQALTLTLETILDPEDKEKVLEKIRDMEADLAFMARFYNSPGSFDVV